MSPSSIVDRLLKCGQDELSWEFLFWFCCLSNGLNWCNLWLIPGFWGGAIRLRYRVWAQDFSKYKLVTSIAKCLRRLLFTKAEDSKSLFTQSHCEASEIAVAGNQTEAIEFTRVEQVHRINDEGAVRSVLPSRIRKLLNRFDCVPLQHFLPRGTRRSGKVSVYPLYGCLTKSCDFRKQSLNDGSLCVVSVNEDS